MDNLLKIRLLIFVFLLIPFISRIFALGIFPLFGGGEFNLYYYAIGLLLYISIVIFLQMKPRLSKNKKVSAVILVVGMAFALLISLPVGFSIIYLSTYPAGNQGR